MAEIKLVAEARSDFGKGAARRLRREGQIPAVLYGHGSDPVHVALPGHQTSLALRQANALFSVELDGKAQLAVVKDVQRDAIGTVIEHIDLLIVKKGEKISVDVPVHITGESAPGTIHIVEAQTLSVEAEATHLPAAIEVSIEGLEAGAVVTAADIALPTGVSLLTDGEHVVTTVTEPRGEAAAAEGEVEASAEAAAE
ncbi:50S ribosomal protein L25/general stress protein Ctc [Xylanimonas protaetiae]|uniref:Large ribosomal subunit protein bL25 n=1 Tax=Xylanimonas protaetiae TaxID=2509457 RepID=A0A4P6F1N3_9MICO|nr:50S ribosomal protein L25/general stress protein Ctc [Xylanimonas protaetiae]QAY69035.1 50S ribosomal protein L25/general stress protein Ctc [Xylanimonas protaetiae]